MFSLYQYHQDQNITGYLKNYLQKNMTYSLPMKYWWNYEEVITKKFNPLVASDITKALLVLPNVFKTSIYFKWNLIKEDEDDNKFVDCAISSNSHLLVTHDNYFNILKEIDFPKIKLATIDEFEIELKKIRII